jgi:hypothetical protein
VIELIQSSMARRIAVVLAAVSLTMAAAPGQAPDATTIIRSVDASVAFRAENVLGFTDTEHYAVFRGGDETHPAAEMTATDHYIKGVGKSYTILSQSGSSIILRFGLKPLLDNEQTINLPGNVEKSWFVTANYDMKLKLGGTVNLNGRACNAIAITAKRKASNAIDGTLWADARDGSIVQIDGTATEAASMFSGPAHMMRQYANVDGFPMAIHARAESDSGLFGHTVVIIDYSNYQLQVRPSK